MLTRYMQLSCVIFLLLIFFFGRFAPLHDTLRDVTCPKGRYMCQGTLHAYALHAAELRYCFVVIILVLCWSFAGLIFSRTEPREHNRWRLASQGYRQWAIGYRPPKDTPRTFVGWLPRVRGNQYQIHKSLIIKGRLLNKQMATLTFWAFSAFLKMSKMPILPCFIINNVDNYSQQWRQFQRAVYKDNWCQLKLQLLSISFLIKNQRTLLLLLIKMQHFALVSKTKFIYQQCG